MDFQEGIQLRDLRPVVRRRLSLALAVAGLVFLSSVVVAALLPNRYEAYAVILVQPQSVSRNLVEAGAETVDLNQRLSIMEQEILSPVRLSKIIDEFDLYREEAEEMTRMEVILLMREDIELDPVFPELEEGVQAQARLHEVPEINTFQITYRSESPKTAAQVANRLAKDFIDEHLRERIQLSGDTNEFVEAELARISSRLEEVEAEIADVEQEYAGRLPSDVDANQRLYERTIASLRDARARAAEAASDASFYRQQAVEAAEFGDVGMRESTKERELQALEVQLAEYQSRGFTEKHPDVVQTKIQIEELKQKMEAESAAEAEDGVPGGKGGLAALSARSEARRAEAAAEAAREEVVRLEEERDEILARINETPRVAEMLGALKREYEHLTESQREFSAKKLEAGVALNMERRQKGEQFRVISSAFEPTEPASPNRPLILILGTMLGLAVGGGAAAVRESSDPTFHAPRELQSTLRVPVLAAVPGILFDADRRALRRRRVLVGAAMALFVGLVLSGAGAGYMWVNGKPGWLSREVPGSSAPAAPMADARERASG